MKNIRSAVAVLTGMAALLLALLSLALCGYARTATPRILSDPGNPAAVASAFFDAVCTGDYETARGCVRNCESLGLENSPETEPARMFSDALRASYAWEPGGDCMVRGVEAVQSLRFTSLDLPAVTGGLRDEIMELLELYVEEARLESDIYDEKGEYRQEVVDRALLGAAENLLADAPTRTTELTLTLRYSGGDWRIVWDDSLAVALNGGAI